MSADLEIKQLEESRLAALRSYLEWKVKCDALAKVLSELLPMQGCLTCQELFEPCSRHGDITKTIARAEDALKKAGVL